MLTSLLMHFVPIESENMLFLVGFPEEMGILPISSGRRKEVFSNSEV
jgi:hypothetical protein